MSKAPGWGGGPWALVVELSVLCPWVCFGKSSHFEAFICCRLLFWRLRALAAGLTGARQKQLVQFWLPGRLWAPIIIYIY